MAVPEAGKRAAPTGAHNQQIVGTVGDLDQDPPGFPAYHHRLELDVRRRASPCGSERGLQPANRRVSPDLPQVGRRVTALS
jgi:hypothetical protein